MEVHSAVSRWPTVPPAAHFSGSQSPGVVLREGRGEEGVLFHTRDSRICGVWCPCPRTSPLWVRGRGMTVGLLPSRAHC